MIQLAPHQVDAISKMHNGCVLVGGTGSGKTLTSLVYVYECILGGETPVYPEHSFCRPTNDVPIYVITTPKKRDTLDWGKEASNIPMHLTTVDSWNNIGKYVDVRDSFFIFDETRVIGSGSWVHSFLKITSKNPWILLSATPADTWMEMIPLFIANGFYKNRTEFCREHVVFSRFSKYPKVERYLNVSKLIRNRDKIFVNMPFVKKTEQKHSDVICNYNYLLYKRALTDRWNVFKDCPIKNISEVCYILRKIVNSDESRSEELTKIFFRHKKVIIFYNFDYELEILRSWCLDQKILFREWNGHKHEEIPTCSEWVYLCQYVAAAEAWDCITTNTIVFFSQTYSYKGLVQAIGRIDRMNTPYTTLFYYHLISASTIDVAIKKNLALKKNFNEKKFLLSS